MQSAAEVLIYGGKVEVIDMGPWKIGLTLQIIGIAIPIGYVLDQFNYISYSPLTIVEDK